MWSTLYMYIQARKQVINIVFWGRFTLPLYDVLLQSLPASWLQSGHICIYKVRKAPNCRLRPYHAVLGLPSTWMGDCLGTAGVVDFSFACAIFFILPHILAPPPHLHFASPLHLPPIYSMTLPLHFASRPVMTLPPLPPLQSSLDAWCVPLLKACQDYLTVFIKEKSCDADLVSRMEVEIQTYLFTLGEVALVCCQF